MADELKYKADADPDLKNVTGNETFFSTIK